ncbi:MAG: MipA/OmpV family protein [Alphaproteobacteria bacterium]|nr:MipA/OmpV family protein [Alphaproteobacteria bacterium]
MFRKAIILIIALAPLGALADDDFQLKASVGGMVLIGPQYMGASKYEPYWFPMVDLQYGPLFAETFQGVGLYVPVEETRTLIFAPAIRWRVKRNLGESWDTFEYIENIRPVATLNTILKFDPFVFNFRMTDGLMHGVRGSSYNLGIAWRDEISDRVNLTLYATAIYGSKTFNQTYFGVTEVEHNKFGYELYDPSAGLKSLDAGGLVKYFVTKNISIDVAFEYMRLTGPAAKSPITYAKDQFMLGIGASYKF